MSSVCDSLPGVLGLDQAVERLLAAMEPIGGVERLPIAEAAGRVLASEVLSPLDLPPFTNSAMDGYAVRAEEAVSGARLRVVGASLAGRPYGGNVAAGECVRIFTGACLPEGAGAVVIQEEVTRQDDCIRLALSSPLKPGANVRFQGEELRAGDGLLAAGTVLRPADIGLLAVAGCQAVDVLRRLRVAILATGDELTGPGQPLKRGGIYESNRPALQAMLTELGMDTLDLGVARDDREALRDAMLTGARQADVLITTGGASVGEADFIVDLLRETGEVAFWKVAIKPGKPFVFGRLGATPVFGLPGNPVSMMVTFLQLARPALLRRAGMPPCRPGRWRAACRDPLRKPPGRMEFLRGVLDFRDGAPGVTALREQGSHRLTSMSRANCFIVLPPDCVRVDAGETVEVEPFDGSGLVHLLAGPVTDPARS